MNPTQKSPFANVIGAFSKGLEGATISVTPPTAAATAPPSPTPAPFDPLVALQILADAPNGQMPFSQFSERSQGDSISALSNTLSLMREGWVEFLGDLNTSSSSEVRLTDLGRQVVETLRKGVTAR